jgi:hypothetical protein
LAKRVSRTSAWASLTRRATSGPAGSRLCARPHARVAAVEVDAEGGALRVGLAPHGRHQRGAAEVLAHAQWACGRGTWRTALEELDVDAGDWTLRSGRARACRRGRRGSGERPSWRSASSRRAAALRGAALAGAGLVGAGLAGASLGGGLRLRGGLTEVIPGFLAGCLGMFVHTRGSRLSARRRCRSTRSPGFRRSRARRTRRCPRPWRRSSPSRSGPWRSRPRAGGRAARGPSTAASRS